MKLIFTALPTDLPLQRAQFLHFSGLPNVEVQVGDICKLQVDAVVSPANSFGFMDGGIDAAYVKRFPAIQRNVQWTIKREWHGELPVGCAFAEATSDGKIPWLIVAPTMRVPMKVASTANAYLAARAAILCAEKLGLSSVAFPGLCTGCGGMSADVSCRQVKQAISDIFYQDYQSPKTTMEAWDRHYSIVDRNASDRL